MAQWIIGIGRQHGKLIGNVDETDEVIQLQVYDIKARPALYR